MSAIVALVLYWADNYVGYRRRAMRSLVSETPFRSVIGYSVIPALLAIASSVRLILVILGIASDQDAALYTTAVVLMVFESAYWLMVFVYIDRASPTDAA